MPGFGCQASCGESWVWLRTTIQIGSPLVSAIFHCRDSITPSLVLRTSSTPIGARTSCSHLSGFSSVVIPPPLSFFHRDLGADDLRAAGGDHRRHGADHSDCAGRAHPGHAAASTITIAKDTILRTMKFFSYGLRAITIEDVNGGLGSASWLMSTKPASPSHRETSSNE